MKKRILCGAFVSIMALTLCSCNLVGRVIPSLSDNPQKTEPATDAAVTTTTQTTTATTAAPEITITLNRYTAAIHVGESVQLTATTNVDTSLQWRSSNEAVALVNGQGFVTAVGAGVANITCFATGGSEVACTVTVAAPTTAAPQITGDGYLFPNVSTVLLTEAEITATLSSLTYDSPAGNYAQDAINEIFARRGFIFDSPKLQAYYEAKSWYVPNENFDVSLFNEYEKSNVSLLKKFK